MKRNAVLDMMVPLPLFSLICLLLRTAFGVKWPNGPLFTSARWIYDASGTNVTYAGVNWPAHAESMLPEGLQYQSIADIISKIKSLGMNSIRLTYATEMVDQIYDNEGKDVDIQRAFIEALGEINGTVILEKVLANNPSFTSTTTRLEVSRLLKLIGIRRPCVHPNGIQVFDAVAAECAKHQIYVHLDNHISTAKWCCIPWDNNTWWGDIEFPVDKWVRGLEYMATHGKSWPAFTSTSLRNELRPNLNKHDPLQKVLQLGNMV